MLKLALCAVSTAMCMSTAHADPKAYGHTLPPKRFSGQPMVPVIDHVVSLKDVNITCLNMGAKPPDGRILWGCAHTVYVGSVRTCLVYRIDDDIVRQHEFGHCAGWPGDHPNELELKALDAKIAALVAAARARETYQFKPTTTPPATVVTPPVTIVTPPVTITPPPLETVDTFEQRWPSNNYSHIIWEHGQ